MKLLLVTFTFYRKCLLFDGIGGLFQFILNVYVWFDAKIVYSTLHGL